MKTATAIAEHLPYLRRYARALMGSQAAGDTAVLGFLQALVGDTGALRTDVAPRVAVYRAFHALRDAWRQEATVASQQAKGGAAVEAALTRLTASNREALLLNAMEGFTIDETAVIVDQTPAAVRASIEAALADIRDQARARVLVIEDEPIIALDLKNILEGMGHDVVGTAATRDEAVALASELEPGLVLADIRLADGSSGIDAVRLILSDFDIPIIFVTAYPERLLTGDRPEPAFLVTKPFAAETIRATVGQALLFS